MEIKNAIYLNKMSHTRLQYKLVKYGSVLNAHFAYSLQYVGSV